MNLSRYFEFNGVRLPDINPKLSVEEIRSRVRAPISRYRYGNNHWAGGGRRQAAVSFLDEPSAQRDNPMSRNPKSKEVTKRAVLAELERLRQGRHARYQTLVGRFARCPELVNAAAFFALPQSRRARALTTARHSTPHPAGFLRSVDGTGKWSWYCRDLALSR